MTEPDAAARLFVALDHPALAPALSLVAVLAPLGVRFKVGLELFTAAGPEGVAAVQRAGGPVLLDLKLHDIPHTVAAAARAATSLGVWGLTAHAGGGPAMLRAAAEALGGSGVRLVAVTVLTSVDDTELAAMGEPGPVAERVLRLGRMAAGCGCTGLVAATADVPALRAAAPGMFLVTPGIRPAGVDAGDQRRTGTPASGGDYLVVGRAIARAADPAAAARDVLAELTRDVAPHGRGRA